jgi:flagellar hook-associated protein 2
MASISSPGIGSGLDINSIISQLMTAASQPLTVLDRKEAVFQAKLSAYGSLKGALATYQGAMRDLTSLAKFQSLKATSSDTSVLAASATSTAAPGNYSIEVKQLAKAQKLASTAFDNVTDNVGTGTLTFQFGTNILGVFTPNSAKAIQTVTIGSANGTLGGIRDAINAAKIGVTAAVLNDGTGNKLIFTSSDTGAANSLKISVSDTTDASNTDNAGLSRLAYDPAGSAGNGRNLTETIGAQNALLKVDGIDNISKAANTLTDVVQGVTISLLKESALNTPATLSVTADTAGVKTAVENFVKSYNDLNKTVKDLTAYDPATQRAAVLQGDSSAHSIVSQVRRVLGDALTGVNGQYSQLSQIGIAFQKDGTLALDNTKLQTAIDANFTDIPALFANIGKPSDSLVSFVSATDKTLAGSYALNITQVATQGLLSGVNTASLAHTAGTFNTAFVIDGSNDTLSLMIDGIQSGTITLTQGSYTTAAALTAELQSKINGDSVLKAASVTASVAFNATSSLLKFTSDRYGTASKVEVTSVDSASATTLGVAVAAGVTGLDVAGSINGIAATGSGRFLSGVGGSGDGLKLEVIGGSLGDRGTVNYSLGYAYRLDQLTTQLLGNAGPISSRTKGINSSVSDINDRREVLGLRLAETEKRYRAQFTALDTLLARLRTTSDYLTQQLKTLPGFTSSGR